MKTESSHSEALEILNEILKNLMNPPFDLKSNLRRCQHVCEILNWEDKLKWLHQEINGYQSVSTLPSYRKIQGQKRWVPGGGIYNKITWDSEEMVHGVNLAIYEIEDDMLEVWTGIDWILSAAQFGYTEDLHESKNSLSPSGRSTLTLERKRIFQSASFRNLIAQIEKQIFDFASMSYAQLRFGDVIGDIWEKYRKEIDAKMTDINLAGHLSSIENGLLSDNPEDWRSAVFECRNLLNDLGNYLWVDKRTRYEFLKGNTDEGTLDVSHGKFGNRISAYLHQKSVTGSKRRFFSEEAERLASSILALIPFQSEAHDPITQQDTFSIAIATYILVGELALRTDLKPIIEYQKLPV